MINITICIGTKVHPMGKCCPTATVVKDLGGAWMVALDATNSLEIWMKSETARWLSVAEEV